MKDHASQQEAILGVALAQGHFGPGVMTALAIAQAEQASDLVAFRSSATPEETWALNGTLAGSVPSQARALGQRAAVAGPGALALGAHAGQQWQAGMSHSVGWMRQAEQQLTDSIASYAQALQRGAVQSAIITAAAALAALALIFLVTLMVARSIVGPLRRLEAAALDVAGTGLPAEVGALGVAGHPGTVCLRHRWTSSPPTRSARWPGPLTGCTGKRCGWRANRPGCAPASAPYPPASCGAAIPCWSGCCG